MSDYKLETTFDVKFTTRRFTTGAPFTLAGSPVISAYPDNSTTQLTAGITLTVDFDAVTGLNNIRVVATAANGYATATNYALVITTGTVDSVSVVGEVVGSFTLEKSNANLKTILGTAVSTPATAGILDVNVKNIDNDAASASGTVTFPNATLASTTNITAGTITTATTATNVTTVNGLAANVITAASIANGAIDAATFAAGAIDAAAIADGAIDALTFAAGAINAAAIAADAITDAKVAADVTIASVTGAVGSVTGNVGGNVVGSVASVVGAVGSVTGNVGGNVVGSVASVTGAVGSVTGAVGSVTAGVALTAAGIDAILDDAVDGTVTMRESLRLANSANGGKASGMATATAILRDLADTKARVTATVDADGNRTAVTLDLT